MSNYYKDGTIQIPKVTGNITVTVTAAESASNYNNKVPGSTDGNGQPYNGVGYADNTRLNSSGGTVGYSGSTATGFFEVSPGDVVRFTGVAWNAADMANVSDGENCYIHFYTAAYAQQNIALRNNSTTLTKEGDVYSFTIGSSSTKYIRLNGIGNGADLIVTVNEPID